ncbi:hypothetical protein ACS0TY_034700 [Phlomoides rotata]
MEGVGLVAENEYFAHPTSYDHSNRDGVLGISRIRKLRNQLVSHRETNIRSNDPRSLEEILRKGFSTGVSYMYSSLFEVSQWCNAVDLLGKINKITLISCFGELSGSRGMESNLFYLISKSSYSTSSNPGWGIEFPQGLAFLARYKRNM